MPPTGFTVTVTGLRADLAWTNQSPGTYNYVQIERRVGANAFQPIAVVHDWVSHYYDDSVRPSVTYDYRLKAYSDPTDTPTASSTQSGAIGSAPSPTASVTVSSATAVIGEAVLVDARGSTNISKRPQDDGTPSFTIDFGDGFTCEAMASGHAYMTAGTYTIRFTGKNASGTSDSTTTSITVSAIPSATGGNVQHLTDAGSAATNKTNLQNAIDAAVTAGASAPQEILLDGTWTHGINGTIVLSGRGSTSHWITIKWTGLTVPHMKRVKPSDFTGAPVIYTMASVNQAAIDTTLNANPPAHHYNLVGIKTYRDVPGDYAYLGVEFGHTAESSTASLPHHIIFDRGCMFSDQANIPTEYSKDGMNIVADYVTVMDSYAGEFIRDTGADATGISISGGRGPVCLWNNEMIAGGENFSANNSTGNLVYHGTVSSPTMTSAHLASVTTPPAIDDQIAFYVNNGRGSAFSTIVRSVTSTGGGGYDVTFDPLNAPPDNGSSATWDVMCSFVEYRRNYTYKAARWDGTESLQIKNLWETKSGRYWWMEGNVFEHAHHKDQPFAIVLGSGSNEASPANTVRNMGWKNNYFKDMFSGIAMTNGMPTSGGNLLGMQYGDWILRNNLFRNVGRGWDDTTQVEMVHFGQGEAWLTDGGVGADGIDQTQVLRAFIIHNTFDDGREAGGFTAFSSFSSEATLRQGTGTKDGLWLNNLQQDQGYGFFSQLGASNQIGTIELYFAPGDTTNWNKNQIVNTGYSYPTGTITEDKLWQTISGGVFVDYPNGNFTLQSGDAGHNAATDGTDVGVDVAALTNAIGASSPSLGTATIKVVTGDWTESASQPRVKLIAISM